MNPRFAWATLLTLSLITRVVAADLEELISGVQKIATPGSPGRVAVFGPDAFAVVMGKAGDTVQPAVAAANHSRGRVVAFGHNGYFGRETLQEVDTGRLLANSIRWAGRNAKPVVVVTGDRRLLDAVNSLGLNTTPADLAKLAPGSVLVADAGRINAANADAITKFIQAGGGFIASATGWGWEQLNPGKDLSTDLAVNAVLIRAGLAIAGDTLSDTAPDGFAVSSNVPKLANATAALAALVSSANGTVLRREDAALAGATLVAAIESLPPDDRTFLPKLQTLTANPKISAVPTQDTPVKSTNPAGRVIVGLQANTLRRARPEEIRAHPAAAAFPGSVPATADRLANVTLQLDTKVPGWHSTGFYAAPGEVISVTLPPNAAQAKLRVRIGAHQDRLWHLDTWRRFPEIAHSWPVQESTTKAANAFGGLIYVEVPRNCPLGQLNVTLSGAVAAPFYVHGKTSPEAWRKGLREAPAPWGELATSKVILTLPAEVLRTLDDPQALMDTWDTVLDLVAELATIPKDRERPERIVCDIQISAGYMHSGYPIMTWMDQPQNFASRESMVKGNWGIFHELGHNHQVPDWTFEGTGEVTCNLFSLYVYEKLCGVKPRDYAHGNGKTRVIDLHEQHFAGGEATFERWKKNPFVALCMYVQLQDAFGWEPYQKVFAEYQALPASQRPKTDQDRRDQWMTRFSKTVGKNLGPFFRTWGVPVTDAASKSVAHLPVWIPEGMSKLP